MTEDEVNARFCNTCMSDPTRDSSVGASIDEGPERTEDDSPRRCSMPGCEEILDPATGECPIHGGLSAPAGESITLVIAGIPVTVEGQETVLGRGPGWWEGITEISRRHARVSARDGDLIVEDLGSKNGTFVNGQRLEPGEAVVVRADATLHLSTLKVEVIRP